MHQTRDSTSFSAKISYFVTRQLSMQNFDCCLCTEVNMLTEIYLGKSPFSQQTHQFIIAKLLSN